MGAMTDEGPEPRDDLSMELVLRVKRGDRSAWEDLYRRYHDPLLLAIRARLGRKLRSHLQSEDVLQSVVKDALSDLAKFEPRGPGSLAHYLHVCVLNKIRVKAQYHGAAKRDGGVALSDSLAERLAQPKASEAAYFEPERFGRFEQGIAGLPESMREVILLRTVEGLSNANAAHVLGKSPEAASKLYNRALARLAATARETPS